MNKVEEEYKKFKGMAHSAGTATSRYGTQCRYSHIKVMMCPWTDLMLSTILHLFY